MRTRGQAHEDNRQVILKAARALVLKHGHAKLSLRQVAQRAGFSPASLYEYFDSKEAIVAALSQEAMASLGKALRAAAGGGEIVEIALAYIAWAKRNSEDYLLLFERLPSKRRDLKQPPAAESPYRVLLEAVQRSHSDSTETLAYGLWSMAHGMAMLQLTHLAGFDADFESSDRTLLAALVAGFDA